LFVAPYIPTESLTIMRKWRPPPEPHKPYLPYTRGTKIHISKHTPPEPFDSEYAHHEGQRLLASEDLLHSTTLVELCFQQAPAEGERATHSDSKVLEITDPIEVKDGHGAQILLCRFEGEPETYVGKVYDPLYYGFPNPEWPSMPRDVTYVADGDYSREAAAYQYLADQQFDGSGVVVPKYHGSWTFSLPMESPSGWLRPVRMIIMENIDGRMMLDINIARMSEPKRLDVIARVIEAESRLRHIGLDQNDVAQRNVILCGYDSSPEEMVERVCLIDFNIAVITERSRTSVEYGGWEQTRLPCSPADAWWDKECHEFSDWFPSEWDDYGDDWHAWLVDRYGNSEEFEQISRFVRPTSDGSEGGSPDGDRMDRDSPPPLSPPLLSPPPLSPPPQLSLSGTGSWRDKETKRRRRNTDEDYGSPVGMHRASSSRRDSHHTPLGHISIGVTDYTSAKTFFTPVLEALGLELVYDNGEDESNRGSKPKMLGYGPSMSQELLNIFEYGDEAHAPGRGCHLAFNAQSRQAVDQFHELALAHGGTCDGKPGPRWQYGPHYYAAYVISPGGWRLEAVCKENPSPPVSPSRD
jgi:catechol 2,3-dioxygenase-like lactoylglutathione lyase family enzyme